MVGDDESLFLEGIASIAPYRLIRNTFKTKTDMVVGQLPDEMGTESLLYISRTDMDAKLEVQYISEQNYHCVDFLDSEVVEFTRCCFEDRRLLPGRLWYEPRKRGRPKRKMFVYWATALLSWIKKHFERRGAYYAGPRACEKARRKEIQLGPDPFPAPFQPEHRSRHG
jgi:hypothetical protein